MRIDSEGKRVAKPVAKKKRKPTAHEADEVLKEIVGLAKHAINAVTNHRVERGPVAVDSIAPPLSPRGSKGAMAKWEDLDVFPGDDDPIAQFHRYQIADPRAAAAGYSAAETNTSGIPESDFGFYGYGPGDFGFGGQASSGEYPYTSVEANLSGDAILRRLGLAKLPGMSRTRYPEGY